MQVAGECGEAEVVTQPPQTAETFWARIRRPLRTLADVDPKFSQAIGRSYKGEDRVADLTTEIDHSACWLFRGAPNKDGYGMCAPPVGCSGSRLVHRIAWELTYGTVPPPLEQTCGNRLCCNPSHLAEAKHREKVRVRRPRPSDVFLALVWAWSRREGLELSAEDVMRVITHRSISDAARRSEEWELYFPADARVLPE